MKLTNITTKLIKIIRVLLQYMEQLMIHYSLEN
jgi:hypothetical protein